MRGYTTDRRVGAEQQVPRIERGETESASPGPRGALCELVEQRTRSLEVGGGQPFGEPGVDLGQQTPRVPSLALPLVAARSSIDFALWRLAISTASRKHSWAFIAPGPPFMSSNSPLSRHNSASLKRAEVSRACLRPSATAQSASSTRPATRHASASDA